MRLNDFAVSHFRLAAFFVPESGCPMPSVTVIPTLPQQIAAAREQVCKHRHHRECCCFQYRDSDREGFCNPQEATWASIQHRLIERAREFAAKPRNPDATAIQPPPPVCS